MMRYYCLIVSMFWALSTLVYPVNAETGTWVRSPDESSETLVARTSKLNRPKQVGSYYETTAPDTLDLAERARLGLNHFIEVQDDNCEMYFAGSVGGGAHQFSPLMACQPKAMEAMAMDRLMTGSTQGLEKEARMLEMLSGNIEDGILMGEIAIFGSGVY